MATIEVTCIHCQSSLVYKHGKAPTGLQRYRCRECKRSFQYEYRYNANKKDVAEKIITMAMNGSGVRDTARVLGVSITTVINHLKNLSPSVATRS